MRISDWSSDVCSSDLYIGHRPAVIRGLVDHWPARSKWSLDAVAEALGDQPVQLQWDRSRDPSYESNSNRHRVKKPFSEVAARLRSHEPSNDFYVPANNRDRKHVGMGTKVTVGVGT